MLQKAEIGRFLNVESLVLIDSENFLSKTFSGNENGWFTGVECHVQALF